MSEPDNTKIGPKRVSFKDHNDTDDDSTTFRNTEETAQQNADQHNNNQSANNWMEIVHAKAVLRQVIVTEVQENLIQLHSESVDASDTQVGF